MSRRRRRPNNEVRSPIVPPIHPRDPEAVAIFGPGDISDSGVTVNDTTIYNASAVYCAINLLSSAIGTIPLEVKEETRKDGVLTVETDYNSKEARMLSIQPCPYRSSMTHFTTSQSQVLLRGNTYTEIQRTKGGDAVNLWFICSDLCRPVFDVNNVLRYEVDVPNASPRYIRNENMIHVLGLGDNGIQGFGVLDKAKDSIGLGIAAEKHGNKQFSNGAVPKGVLSSDQTLDDKAIKRMETQWDKRHQGLNNSHRIAILEAGLKYQNISFTNAELEFLQTRKFQISEIARWFNVPPHMLKDLEKSSFSNIIHQSSEFILYSVLPWLIRYEQEINRKLFMPSWTNTTRRYCKFNFDVFLRPDMLERYKAYQIAIMSGWLNRDECRFMEGRNPIPDNKGSEFLTPLNMGPVGALQDGQQNLVN